MSNAGRSAAYKAWQTAAWTHYDSIGEIHYGLSLVASVLSRVRIYAGSAVNTAEAPIDVDKAAERGDLGRTLARRSQELLSDLAGVGFPGMVRTFALNVAVPGEVYLAKLPGDAPDTEVWAFRSTDEISVTSTGVTYRPTRTETSVGEKKLDKDTFIARIWQMHPRHTTEPDSSMAAIADPAEELLMLSRLTRSAMRSRMNAGILFVPDGLAVAGSAPAEVVEEIDPDTGDVVVNPLQTLVDPGGQFLSELMDAMVKPISDETNAASVVPMVVTGPSDLADRIKHYTFERSIDQWLSERADRALERILQGLDVPKDVVTGLANVKYSNAIQIDENLYKAHIEPMALMLVDALTQVYLRPLLLSEGFERSDTERVVVWYDPSEIVTRPNSAADANEGYDRFAISPVAWRREHGFAETDAPTEAELALMLLTKLSQMPAEVTAALYTELLPKILGEKRTENIADNPVPMPQSALRLLQPGSEASQIPDAAQGRPA